MKIQDSDIIIQHDPISYATGYVILQGSPHQTYDTQAMQYDPSRSIVPLVIMPWVSASDPNGVYSGQCSLNSVTAVYRKVVSGAWVDVAIDGTDPTKYYISDGEEHQGVTAPAGAIVFFVNVPPTEISSIIITANVVDGVDGLIKSFENTVDLSTKTGDLVTYKLRIDEGVVASGSIDPRDVAKTNGVRLLTLSVQLYKDNMAVADAYAVYFWYLWDGTQYAQITPSNQHWLKTAFLNQSTNELPRTIQVDIDHFDQLRLMVSAAPIGDTTPTQPDFLHDSERVYFDYKRACRKDVEGIIVGDIGIKLVDDEFLQRSVLLRDKNGDIPDADVNEHFRIEWFVRNGNNLLSIGDGIAVAGRARSDFLATYTNVTSLHPKVFFMKCWKRVLVNGVRVLDTNGDGIYGRDYINI